MSNAQKSAVGRCLANVEPEPIDWLWWQRFARGKTNIIAGQPGQEKSQLTIFMAATVTRGGSWPDGEKCPTGNVLIISCEDDAADNDAPGEAAAQDAARRWIAGAAESSDRKRSRDRMCGWRPSSTCRSGWAGVSRSGRCPRCSRPAPRRTLSWWDGRRSVARRPCPTRARCRSASRRRSSLLCCCR